VTSRRAPLARCNSYAFAGSRPATPRRFNSRSAVPRRCR
jgi:hypothetical protein